MAIETVEGQHSVQTLRPNRETMPTHIDYYAKILAGKARKDADLRARLKEHPITLHPLLTAKDLRYDNFGLAIIAMKRFFRTRTLPKRVINIIPPRPCQ